MCLVSFAPTTSGGFILSSNRDESPLRSVHEIKVTKTENTQLVYPEDTKGGSWIIASREGKVVCLLNGAFIIHERVLPYRISRGHMLKAFFNYKDTRTFLEYFTFLNIEPFTMIIAGLHQLIEFRWDGHVKHIEIKNPNQPAVWSSCTLYSQELQEKRTKYFQHQYNDIHETDLKSLANIHLSKGPFHTSDAFVMDRNDIVRTISLTQVQIETDKLVFSHQNLQGSPPLNFQNTWPLM